MRDMKRGTNYRLLYKVLEEKKRPENDPNTYIYKEKVNKKTNKLDWASVSIE